MLLTEEEAKIKVCPFGAIISIFIADRGIEGTDVEFCSSSDCMMWRQNGNVVKENGMVHEAGYCGLAGKPE